MDKPFFSFLLSLELQLIVILYHPMSPDIPNMVPMLSSQSTTTPDRKAKSNVNVILLELLLTELHKSTRQMNQLIQLKTILQIQKINSKLSFLQNSHHTHQAKNRQLFQLSLSLFQSMLLQLCMNKVFKIFKIQLLQLLPL